MFDIDENPYDSISNVFPAESGTYLVDIMEREDGGHTLAMGAPVLAWGYSEEFQKMLPITAGMPYESFGIMYPDELVEIPEIASYVCFDDAVMDIEMQCTCGDEAPHEETHAAVGLSSKD